MKQKKIAIFLFDIQDVSGGGGVERFWADVFRMYPKDSKDYKLYFRFSNHHDERCGIGVFVAHFTTGSLRESFDATHERKI